MIRPEYREVRSAAGADLHVRVWAGNSPTNSRGLLLVHGLASNARMWDGVAGYLVEAGHPVAAVDLRGHGHSSKPNTGYDFATMCVDLDAVLVDLASDGAGWTTPVVAGQSYGANLAMELGATRPWLISGVVCVDGGTIELSVPFPDWESCAGALAPPRIDSVTPEELEKHLRSVHPDWPDTGIQGMLANFVVNALGFVEPCLSFDRHMTILHELWQHKPTLLYGSMAVPVLLVPAGDGHGTTPIYEKKREVEAAVAALPQARAQWFAADHDIHAQFPRELAALIHDCIADGFFG